MDEESVQEQLFAGAYLGHIYNQEGKDIGSHCWEHQLCS